jgi:uncharacterized protein
MEVMAKLLTLPAGALVPDGLVQVALREKVRTAAISAIGGVDSLTLGYFDRRTKSYQQHRYMGFMEVTSLLGNVTEKDGKPFIHVHGTFGKKDMTLVAGHVIRARVFPTLEVVLEPTSNRLVRRFDSKTGLNLIHRSG